MIIACPRCGASYAVEARAFGPQARTVECSACGERWRQPPAAPARTTATLSPKPPAATRAPADRPEEPLADDGPAGDTSAAEPAAAGGSPWPFDTDPESPLGSPEVTPPDGGTADPRQDEAPDPAQAAGDAAADGPEALTADAAGETANPTQAVDAKTGSTRSSKPPAGKQLPGALQKLRAMRKQLLVGGIAGTATLCALGALAIVLRDPVVSILPGAAGVYAVVGLAPDPIGDGLEIRDVASTRERQGGDDVLTVRGVVANIAASVQPLPPLRVSLWNASDEEVQFVTVSHGSGRLAPGERVDFEARIVEPKPEARVLRVGFAQPEP